MDWNGGTEVMGKNFISPWDTFLTNDSTLTKFENLLKYTVCVHSHCFAELASTLLYLVLYLFYGSSTCLHT